MPIFQTSFYVWLRRSLRSVFPDLFATLAVPKAEELVATPYRHGDKQKAETFLLRRYDAAGGERAAVQLVGKLGIKAESVCELCCRLYTLCERKKRAAEALAYNSLVQSRPEIVRLADEITRQSEQSLLFDERED